MSNLLNGIAKANGQVHPVDNEINDLPGFIENEVKIANTTIPIPAFYGDAQPKVDYLKQSAKHDLLHETKTEDPNEKKENEQRKLKTFEIVCTNIKTFFKLK